MSPAQVLADEKGSLMKTYWIALMLAVLSWGCSQVLGLKDPSLEAETDGPPGDGPGSDGSMNDAPPVQMNALWTFTTTTQFTGGFGTAGARTAADTKCDDMYRFAYTSRQCTKVHAVLQVDNTVDTLSRMATTYQIPSALPVLRATDGIKVAARWDDFVNPNLQLLEAVTPSASAVYFWSGKGVSSDLQCTSWTSSANAAFGSAGDAHLRGGWIAAAFLRCDDLSPHLLCVCW